MPTVLTHSVLDELTTSGGLVGWLLHKKVEPMLERVLQHREIEPEVSGA